MRAHLVQIAVHGEPITYKMLADALEVRPPNSIHQVTEALESLMGEDAANGHPFIAALVIGRNRNRLPAPGFFETARQLGRFRGDPAGLEAHEFHKVEFASAVAYWGGFPAGHANADSRRHIANRNDDGRSR